MSEVVSILVETGRKIDPVMERYLSRHAAPEFLEAILYQVKAGGKRIRPALTMVSAGAAGGRIEDSYPAAAAVEIIHNYSLILDDIIDHSEKRRGKPTVWKKYGLSTAILVAVHYRESAVEALNDTPDPVAFHELLAWTDKELLDGERLDVLMEQAGREDEPYVMENRLAKMGIEDYLKMVEKKTARLIETSCRFGGMSVGAPRRIVEALARYGYNVGIAFQVGDDIIDLFGVEERTGKRVGQDIKEHKLGNVVTLLALEELEGSERGEELRRIITTPQISWGDVKRALEIIAETGAKKRAEEIRDRYVEEALQALNELGENEYTRLLRELAVFIKEREY